MNATKEIYASKYGFHPCGREHYLKLKKVKYYAHVSRQQGSAYDRWYNKLPHNRVRRIPIIENDRCIGYDRVKWQEPLLCPTNLDLLWHDFNRAKPSQKESDVKALTIDEATLDAMIESCEKWLKQIGKDQR